ncbi:histamine N-methyltransferase [Rhinatrema bivittatum]|uniref:histamine N-methyltransferase n=1 Tax=Rhinatrema bivittatum TaxID=194408 RepID=UPI00112798A4|nr:histamine N-methyltransferase [Rhinatrema bivittatum]
MEPSMKNLLTDEERYAKAFHAFIDNSTEHECMLEFIAKMLPDIVQSFGDGKSTINILGVGSGSGEIDLQMISQIKAQYPKVLINSEVIEPNKEQVHKFKDLVTNMPDLKNISFTWHEKTSSDYENDLNEKNESKIFDFIHLIQMLYYVDDIPATLKYFISCLAPNGRLLIILVSGKSGWAPLWKAYGNRFRVNNLCLYVTSSDIKDLLDEARAKYTYYDLPSEMDITECFVEGSETGLLLLDFLTEILNFSETAPLEIKADVMEMLKQSECSEQKDGKTIFNNTLGVFIVEP